MPYEKRRVGKRWQVVKAGTDKVLGTHDSEAGADAQIAAIGTRTHEKSAVSLLFALLQTNPSPFCVLDEADAMLEDEDEEESVDDGGASTIAKLGPQGPRGRDRLPGVSMTMPPRSS